MHKTALVLAAAGTLGLSAIAAPSAAEARGWGHGGWGRGGFGPGLAGGLIAGAVVGGLASSAWGYGPGYGYYGGYAPAYYGYGPGYAYNDGYYGGGYPWGAQTVVYGGYGPGYGYGYRRVRPAYAYYGGPRYVHRYHRW